MTLIIAIYAARGARRTLMRHTCIYMRILKTYLVRLSGPFGVLEVFQVFWRVFGNSDISKQFEVFSKFLEFFCSNASWFPSFVVFCFP